MERNSRVNHAQALAAQGWVTSWEEGTQGVEELKAWAIQGCVAY